MLISSWTTPTTHGCPYYTVLLLYCMILSSELCAKSDQMCKNYFYKYKIYYVMQIINSFCYAVSYDTLGCCTGISFVFLYFRIILLACLCFTNMGSNITCSTLVATLAVIMVLSLFTPASNSGINRMMLLTSV